MNPSTIVFASLLLGGLVVVCILVCARRTRRRTALAVPLSDEWIAILKRSLVPYAYLSDDHITRLHECIRAFIHDTHFEGCGGLSITDEMRVTIAGQACLLLLGRRAPVYPNLRTVLVYPHTYVAGKRDEVSVRLGESWQSGVVVLAWDSVISGARNFDDGRNVTVHEFSHQLDQEDGAADGAPVLVGATAYRSWAQCLGREYKIFLKRVKAGRKTVIDPYGATNPAEYFATATEAFFEKPKVLARKRPELFDELKSYYAVDPRAWE